MLRQLWSELGNPRSPFYAKQLFSFEALFILFIFASIYSTYDVFPISSTGVTVLVAASSVLVAFVLWIRGDWEIRPIAVVFFIAYGLFVLYIIMSLMWSPSSDFAYHKLVRMITIVPWAIGGTIFVIGQSNRRFKRFIRLLFFFAFALSLFVYYLVIFTSVGRVYTGEVSYLHSSRLIGVGGLITVYWFAKAHTRWKRILLSVIFLGMAAGILLTGARGSFVALWGASSAFILLQFIYKFPFLVSINHVIKIFSALVALVIVFISIVIKFPYLFADLGGFGRFINLLDTSGTGSLAPRIEMYQQAFDMWVQSPLIGHGFGGFDVVYGGWPHNIVMELLSELGLLGLLLFSILVIISLYRFQVYYAGESRYTSAFLISFVVYWFIAASLSFTIPGNRELFISLALLCSSFDVINNSTADSTN